MQEENSRLLREKADLLHEENVMLKEENQSLHGELQVLRGKLSQHAENAQYVTRDGMAFRQKADGSYEETPYCPNCHGVMGKLSHKSYQCAKCKHATQVQTVPELAARLLNKELPNKA